VYIGTPENDQFTGPQDPQALAEHIYQSFGPSGSNKEYLLCLESSLDGLSRGSGDGHVKDLAERVRAIETRDTGKEGKGKVEQEVVGNEISKVTDEQEETEK
jgi:cation transport protein ChaC